MARDLNKHVVAVAYTADDGNVYALGMRASHAEASAATPAGPELPAYPRGWVPRHIGGLGDDGIQRTRLVIPGPFQTLFVSNGAVLFNITGVGQFVKTGSTGEKRPHKYANT